jgi:hypothetical protein
MVFGQASGHGIELQQTSELAGKKTSAMQVNRTDLP